MKSKDERRGENFSVPLLYFHFRGDCNSARSREPNLDGFYDARYYRFYDSDSDYDERSAVGGRVGSVSRASLNVWTSRARRCLKGKSDNWITVGYSKFSRRNFYDLDLYIYRIYRLSYILANASRESMILHSKIFLDNGIKKLVQILQMQIIDISKYKIQSNSQLERKYNYLDSIYI